MGSVPVNDENLGVHRGGKRTSSSDDIFAIEQPTGRQSILRQTENLPNKTVPKGGKVCFQTPRRDPVSKRILSPSKSVKMDNLVECMKALDSLRLDSKPLLDKIMVKKIHIYDLSHPDDEMPIKSTGGYLLDFDNLDTMDPFSGSKKFALSPTRPSIEDLPLSPNQPEAAFQEAGEPESALDETLPFNRSVENSLAEVSSTESSVVTYKVALGSYKKNEETLKGCAQEYLVRIRKEEQRYQTLKSYTEEKISKANEETGEVRSRLKAEVSGLQAQLRREQLKSQALESNYDQKVKEVVELTNLCDELIAKVQTG
uniref:Transforming acidic coiled-coil-containing protein C-terminal domain-containing protein n=1 Tax=Gadus morhua TaxID=8049 RepID=A0A8C4ZBK5_GADMO